MFLADLFEILNRYKIKCKPFSKTSVERNFN